ncbi:MAG TPA: kelch repeat-containing protein [Planctomycetota bacterium]|nr:kelch repeat-containing protein [Planctomycetota bacterium]HRR81071.1 kelch repeat-containing protein [Planctomycetota bacterium]
MSMRIAVAVLWASVAAAGEGAAPQAPASLADAPPNTWVKALVTKTGWREQPLFVYVPPLKRFVMASGMQAYGGTVPRHYDTEELDFAQLKWFNAYPPDVAAGRPESGPVGEEYAERRAKMGHNGPELFYKDGDHLRVGAGGQWLESRMGYEWCYVPEDGKIYAYLHDKTLRYDPNARTWEDLKAKPRTTCRLWGSMTYDPVNREILHAGGDGGSADVATWAFDIAGNEWRRLEFGSPEAKALLDRAKALRWQAKALLGAACNRFAITETDAEAKADLAAQAAELAAAAEKLAPDTNGVAARRLAAAVAAVKAASAKLSGKITPDIIAEVRAARVLFEQAVDALAVEPPGRARSQTAYDPVHKKIVLFGGDGLDRVLSDTWVYDCAARTWEQRFPEKCPTPRAGHILAWLPKARKIVLAGGYSRDWLPQEVWTYDVAANEWKPLLHVPLQPEDWGRQKFSPNAPRVTCRDVQTGAVNDDDVLVCVTPGERPSLITWACKIDPSVAASVPLAEGAMGTSGAYTFNRIDPAIWEQAARPDPEAMAKLYRHLPANVWTSLDFPRYAPGARNRWGTTAYDTARHQLLFWGGGHATSQENDVAHFSLRGGCWTLGYHPDDPIDRVYASQPTPLSFNDRAHVPVHAYKAYCYDAAAGKMLYFDRAYNPAVREWEPQPFPGLEHRGVMHSFMAPTPRGAVTYSDKGLFLLDAKAGKWNKLPWDGPPFGGIWCDGHGLRYDSKRDCLWFANDKDIWRYDLATGKAAKLGIAKPKALGQFIFWGEQVYLPDADLMLLMRLFTAPDGKQRNIVWDPADGRFFWADLKFEAKGKPVEFKDNPFSWSDALCYDPALKLAILNNSSDYKVWVLRFDRNAVKMEVVE